MLLIAYQTLLRIRDHKQLIYYEREKSIKKSRATEYDLRHLVTSKSSCEMQIKLSAPLLCKIWNFPNRNRTPKKKTKDTRIHKHNNAQHIPLNSLDRDKNAAESLHWASALIIMKMYACLHYSKYFSIAPKVCILCNVCVKHIVVFHCICIFKWSFFYFIYFH